MAMKDKQNSKSSISLERRVRYYGLVICPGDILGWLRIPAAIMLLTGGLGIIKETLSVGYRLLRPVNFPPTEWCWVLLALSAAFYLFCVIKTIVVRNRPPSTEIYDRSVIPQRWRSF